MKGIRQTHVKEGKKRHIVRNRYLVVIYRMLQGGTIVDMYSVIYSKLSPVLWYTSFKADSLSLFHYGSDKPFCTTTLLVHVRNTG
jgi:hypothetical protein